MRNKYKGICYYCGKEVKIGKGHFERYNNRWQVTHAGCVFEQRKQKALIAENEKKLEEIYIAHNKFEDLIKKDDL